MNTLSSLVAAGGEAAACIYTCIEYQTSQRRQQAKTLASVQCGQRRRGCMHVMIGTINWLYESQHYTGTTMSKLCIVVYVCRTGVLHRI